MKRTGTRNIFFFLLGLITFFFSYCALLLILMVLYTLISRRLGKRKIPGNVTEERDKSSEQEKRRVTMAFILIAVVFAAHVKHSMTYFRRMDV